MYITRLVINIIFYVKMFKINGTKFRRWLTHDIIIKDKNLYLVSNYYPDILFDFTKIFVSFNGETCKFISDTGNNRYEPDRTVVYSFGSEVFQENKVIISTNTQTEEFIVKPHNEYKGKHVLINMFKDDYPEIEYFVKYYKKQGIEQFVLCYNGKLSNIEEKLYKDPCIEYTEMDSDFWVDGFNHFSFENPCPNLEIVDPKARINWHGAMINNRSQCSLKYDKAKSITYVDLDEFVFCRYGKYTDLIEKYSYVIIRTTFSKSENFPLTQNEEKITINNDYCLHNRMKYIMSPEKMIFFKLKEHFPIMHTNFPGWNTDSESHNNQDLFIIHLTNNKRENEMKANTRQEILEI